MALAGAAVGATPTTLMTWDEILGSVTIPTTGVTLDKSYSGKVYTFDGTKGMIGTSEKIGDALSATSGYITIAAWVSPGAVEATVYGDYKSIFGWGEDKEKGLVFDLKDNDLNVTTKNVKENIFSDSNVTCGDTVTWTMVALTINIADKAARAYQGTADNWTNTAIGTWNAPTNDVLFAIGAKNSNGTENLFEGKIGAVTILSSDDYLTNAQIATALGAAPVAIPEPTTATLSLLALAGLAARRRRASR